MEGDVTLDCRGMTCPMPILKTAQKIKEVEIGQVLEVVADDIGAEEDFPAWCNQTGNEFLGEETVEDYFKFYIKRRV